jgi:hypothetical protein
MADLTTWKTGIDIAASVVQTLAILIAGIWAIWRFWVNREKHPKAEIQHDVEALQLSAGRLLIHVAITVKNISSVLMQPTVLLVRVLQVLPLDKELARRVVKGESLIRSETRQGDWLGIGQYESNYTANEVQIEPGECHPFFFDFDVPSDIEIFQVYSYLKNSKVGNRDLGWNHKTMHKHDPNISTKQAPAEPTPRQAAPEPPPRPQSAPEPPPRQSTPPPERPDE